MSVRTCLLSVHFEYFIPTSMQRSPEKLLLCARACLERHCWEEYQVRVLQRTSLSVTGQAWLPPWVKSVSRSLGLTAVISMGTALILTVAAPRWLGGLCEAPGR